MFQNYLIITGAGISVESGIKPFRGKGDTIWKENPQEIATNYYMKKYPLDFLEWYYKRFSLCKHALPNEAHEILAQKKIKLITQNIDNLHVKAQHPKSHLLEIHGNIFLKRKLNVQSIEELEFADWDKINENQCRQDLAKLFHLNKDNQFDQTSYRPHILLFDEYYTSLYQIELAQSWLKKAETIVFIGTSNSVGITQSILQDGLNYGKKILVVDPQPDASFNHSAIELHRTTATDFCKKYFN
ncbi:MAG: hypothetical protein ORN85_08705 [Sediminibacterium sp.]|nr:hypothetical protein [Sediminibacterium sp.]